MAEEAVPTIAELELDGKIFFVEKDQEGNVVSREELDGELVLRALLTVIEDAVRSVTEPTEETP
jgi:hypothetical protein